MWDLVSSRRSKSCSLEHAGLPLLLQQQVKDLQTLCSLLQTSKAAREAALAHCSVPLLCSPATLEQAEHIAEWVTKYGSALDSFEWKPRMDGLCKPSLDLATRAAAFAALAAALQQAAASPQGLRLRSCKLASVSWDCDVILQQLPVNSLTSLDVSFRFPYIEGDQAACERQLAGVMAALPQMQQLRNLVIDVHGSGWLEHVDPLMKPLSSLTNLTRLEVGSLWSLGELQHTPHSLLELEYSWELFDTPDDTLSLSHLTALTKLTTGRTEEIFGNSELPPSLKVLQCGRLVHAKALLPLRYLQRLDILNCLSTAEELLGLSSLTALTHITICYIDSFDRNPELYASYSYANDYELTPDAASAAWPALASQLRVLHIEDDRGSDPDVKPYQLSAAAVAALGSLTALTSLQLHHLQCPEVQPQQLAAALRRCTALQVLDLGHLELQWGPVQGLTGDADADAALLDAAEVRGMQVIAVGIASLPSLQQLALCRLPVDMHAAVALAAAAAGTRLTELSMDRCDLPDCAMSALALGLTNLRSLELKHCDVGDGALPALARLPLQRLSWDNCEFSVAALDLFLPRWKALRAAPVV